jgi:hypothetical protein
VQNDQKYPDWFLWILKHGFVVFFVLIIIALGITIVVGYYFERRLDSFEERLIYQPPRSYEPPDLNAYAAEGVSPESIEVQRAVYVPIYSHVYYNRGRPYLLEATLSIRNTDLQRPVYIRSVRYYGTKGELVKKHVDRLIRLGPLETIEFLVEARDTTGGSGANFIVEWLATEQIDEPIIEAVMVGIEGSQGICFSRGGRNLSFFPAPSHRK